MSEGVGPVAWAAITEYAFRARGEASHAQHRVGQLAEEVYALRVREPLAGDEPPQATRRMRALNLCHELMHAEVALKQATDALSVAVDLARQLTYGMP